MLYKLIGSSLLYLSVIILTVTLTMRCTEIFELLRQSTIKEPDVRISKVNMTGLSFDRVDLLFNIDINNPNNVGITLAGFDYDLQLEQKSFISGNQTNSSSIKANGTETIQLPLSLEFLNIYKTLSEVKDLDSIQYKIDTGLLFTLPVLGNIRIPVSKSGFVPALKLPSVRLSGIKLDKLDFTGADLTLSIKLNNPNAYNFALNSLQYQLNINGAQWFNSKLNESVNINANNDNVISIPVSVNFVNIGRSAYTLLSGNKSLEYKLTGNANLNSNLSLLGSFNIPFNQTGETQLIK